MKKLVFNRLKPKTSTGKLDYKKSVAHCSNLEKPLIKLTKFN